MPKIRKKSFVQLVEVRSKVNVVNPCEAGCDIDYEILLLQPTWEFCPICKEKIIRVETVVVDNN